MESFLHGIMNMYLMLGHTRLSTNSLLTGFEATVCCDEYVPGDQMISYGGMMNYLRHLEDFVDRQD